MSVVIETTIGDITVDLYLKERPNTCLNFLKLCKMKYYNLCLFYKIEKNFIAQTGDPTATGRGGESVFCHLYGDQAKYFDAETKPRIKHEKFGTLSMVNSGNNMYGSQFFLTLSENLTYLDEEHSVFGEVAEGFEILQKLNDAICDNNNRPYQDIRITHTVVLHDPFEDPKGLVIPDASPEPTKEMLESNYIGADEVIDDNEGKTAEEIEEKIKESEAKARATILEMVGDIPDAEVKPPETVLFVCKLNPVTTSEDLEIIFSRFGKILSCEVIKDKKTGDSLQYAFIEFEEEKSCEDAFFKMNNVLIDDRRIRVDWSQSTSKLGRVGNTKVKSNFSLKKTGRNDDYDLIFDMEDVHINNKQAGGKYHKSRTDDARRELKRYDQKNYEKRYKDGDRFERSKEGRSDTYDKSKSKYLEHSFSRNYRDSDQPQRKPESSPKRYRRSEKRDRHDSMSPEYRKRLPQSSDARHYKEYEKKRRYYSPSPEYSKESQKSFSKHDKELKKKPRYDSIKTSESSSKHNKDFKKRNRYDSKSPEHSKKSGESLSKRSEARHKNVSVSPDRTKNSHSKYRDEVQESYSRTKHSSYKYDDREYPRNKSLRNSEKIESDSSSNKHKADMLREKSKKSKRKSPVSSSSSSSDSDSSSSSSSSDSDYKEKRRKQKKVSSSQKKSKSHKKRKL